MGFLAALLAGIVSWSLLEYLIHRFMGHHRRLRRSPFGVEHTRHHAEGDYFAPTWKKVLSALATSALVMMVVGAWLGPLVAAGATTGLMGCYAVYEWLHRREHTCAWRGPYGRWARRHHFAHHLVDPRKNFGVTSPLWDLVFRTYQAPPDTIVVPARLGLRWLDASHAPEFAQAPRRG